MTNPLMQTDSELLRLPKRGMPVTIITGFLGSGKTTLLNHILSNAQGLKVAVLVNEFGDINIDSQLLVTMEEGIVELSNGCICCTINDGLVDAVYRVLERSDSLRDGKADRIDYMVIETTGVADPFPIIFTFLGTDLRDLTRLDGILTVVDAETFTPDHFDSEAALKQIAYADLILLNKTDLVSLEKIQKLERYIGVVKVGAKILHTQYGKVPLPLILDVDYHQLEDYDELIKKERQGLQHNHEHNHHHDHDPHHSHHLENDGFVSVSFESDRPFVLKKFENFLTHEMPLEVFRAKGFLWFSESEMRHIFQLSGSRFDIKTEEWLTSPKNQVVFIGRNLDADALRQQLSSYLK